MKKISQIFTIFTLATMLVFISCQKEMSTPNQNLVVKKKPFKFQMSEAVAYFNGNYKLAEQNGDFSPIIQLKPSVVWNNALQGYFNDVEFYEVPLSSNLGSISPRERSNIKPKTDELWDFNRLIVMKNADGSIESKFMTVIPDKAYLDNPDKRVDLETMGFARLPFDFSGLVQYYNLDGTFWKGWKYVDGQMTGGVTMTDPRNEISQREVVCTVIVTDWFSMNTGEYLGATSSTSCTFVNISGGCFDCGITNYVYNWSSTSSGGSTGTSNGVLVGEPINQNQSLCANAIVFTSLSTLGQDAGLRNVRLGFRESNGDDLSTDIPYLYFRVDNQTTSDDIAFVFNAAYSITQNRLNNGDYDRFKPNPSQLQSVLRFEFVKRFNEFARAAPLRFYGVSNPLQLYSGASWLTYRETRVTPGCN